MNLSLRSKGISGEFPVELFNLKNLRLLYHQFNQFEGELPKDFTVWKNLILIPDMGSSDLLAIRNLFGCSGYLELVHPGKNVGIGNDHTIFSLIDGFVKFEKFGPDKKKAEVDGQKITWLTPHALQQVMPQDIDYKIMLTFLVFNENDLMGKVRSIDLMDTHHSTLQRDVSSNAFLSLNDIIKDLSVLRWQECCITAVETINCVINFSFVVDEASSKCSKSECNTASSSKNDYVGHKTQSQALMKCTVSPSF
ncbi:nucleic acid-binding, OB-fold protein [Tanacetum coccineum]